MDERQFDLLTRSVGSGSRRMVLRATLATLASALWVGAGSAGGGGGVWAAGVAVQAVVAVLLRGVPPEGAQESQEVCAAAGQCPRLHDRRRVVPRRPEWDALSEFGQRPLPAHGSG